MHSDSATAAGRGVGEFMMKKGRGVRCDLKGREGKKKGKHTRG